MGLSLVLASQSPRRRELMAGLGLAFVAQSAEVTEKQQAGESAREMVLRLSKEKAEALAEAYPDAVIVGADTVVVLDDCMLGKPADVEDAVRMLRAMRARSHWVFSAVTALSTRTGRAVSRLNESRVRMRDYSDSEIDRYVASGDPMDKAGAYAIQHQQFAPVARYKGCYAAIMGLALGDLAEALALVGFVVPGDVAQNCAAATGSTCCSGNR